MVLFATGGVSACASSPCCALLQEKAAEAEIRAGEAELKAKEAKVGGGRWGDARAAWLALLPALLACA